jgi:hypothetical protein
MIMDHQDNTNYSPDQEVPAHIRAKQQAFLEAEKRAAATREERYKREEKARQEQEARQSKEEKKRLQELKAEREQMAQEQLERDKARLRGEFEAAGGTKEEWAGFWERNRDRLLLERMEANRASVAHPSSYARGDRYGGTSFTTRRV